MTHPCTTACTTVTNLLLDDHGRSDKTCSILGSVTMQCHFVTVLTGFASVVVAFAADINLQQAASLVTHEPPAPNLAKSFEVHRIAH